MQIPLPVIPCSPLCLVMSILHALSSMLPVESVVSGRQFLCSALLKTCTLLLHTDAMSQNFVMLEVVRELLQTQEPSYQAADH